MDSIVVVKAVMPEESLPQGIEGEVISVYTVKSIFAGMKKTYMVEKKEFFLEILSAADVFWELLAQCDVSVLERKNKIQEIRKKL